jgi:diguanylate cyclase (GGDEF)-like protein
MKTTPLYFVETQPLIYQRLLKTIRVLWVAGIVVFMVGLAQAVSMYLAGKDLQDAYLFHQIVSSLIFLPYVPVMIYAGHLAKSRPRSSTRITLLATFIMLTSQLVLNGNEAVHAMFAFPVYMVLVGVFTNTQTTRLSIIATAILITGLTVCGLLDCKVYNPDSPGFFSIKNYVYIMLVLYIVYVLILIIVHDFFVIQSDLTKQKQRAERVASHDPLTGLYNRYYSERTFTDFFAETKPDERGYILFMDVDNFKMINTRLGHKGGDLALQMIAKRLRQAVKNYRAVACRIGGDEFIVLLVCTPENTRQISQNILDTVSGPFELFSETLQITCSIGIAQADTGNTFQEVYRQADTAMHRAKYAGKNTQIEHQQIHTDEELARARILSRLQQALARNEFQLHYQPQVDLNTGAVIGMEALLRWKLDGKELLPDKFIELAERYGLIQVISNWVIRQACRDCKSLHDRGYRHLFVAVNISAVLLSRNNLTGSVVSSLLETGLPARALELELTESALFQYDHAGISAEQSAGYEQLRRIRELGVELAIDDFGTGYSNLHYLGQLDIQRLKIDKSFVMQLNASSSKARDLVSAIIDIAKRFRLQTVAEGIETPEAASALQNMHCDIGQGYYWSRPVPIESIMVFLDKLPGNKALALPA